MATIQSLVDRVRIELGDLGKSFVTSFVADGTTNRFKLHYAPLDANNTRVFQNGSELVDGEASVEEQTGVLVLSTVPPEGDEFIVSGNYYRYFTAAEMNALVTNAITMHTAGHSDSTGRKVLVQNLPLIDEYPVVVYAVTLALYALATDSAFDIDIQAPDGVSIPRSERYRQLMEMMNTRQNQYKDLCAQLGLGMYGIDVFTLNRISKATNRLIPVYKPQEVDDRSYPQRVHTPHQTYGDKPSEWPTESGELTAYQGRPFITDISFEYDTGTEFVAKLLSQRGSVLQVQPFTAVFDETDEGQFTATLSLTGEQTLRLSERTYWSIQKVEDGDTVVEAEIKGGNFFTVRSSTVVI